jgi:hypothetical protein
MKTAIPVMEKNESCSRDFYIAKGASCGKTHALWKARLQNGNCYNENRSRNGFYFENKRTPDWLRRIGSQ